MSGIRRWYRCTRTGASCRRTCCSTSTTSSCTRTRSWRSSATAACSSLCTSVNVNTCMTHYWTQNYILSLKSLNKKYLVKSITQKNTQNVLQNSNMLIAERSGIFYVVDIQWTRMKRFVPRFWYELVVWNTLSASVFPAKLHSGLKLLSVLGQLKEHQIRDHNSVEDAIPLCSEEHLINQPKVISFCLFSQLHWCFPVL